MKKSIPIFQRSIDSNILIGSVILLSLISDRYIPKSVLSVPLIISILISYLTTKWMIPLINKLNIKQIIRVEGPKDHNKKSGTPTMGGLLIVPIGVIVGSITTHNQEISPQVFAINFIILAFMFIGAIDDLNSLKNKTNTGLSPKLKILLQTIGAIIFILYANWNNLISSTISLPLNISISLGIFIFPLALFVFLAESNSTNLTDGLDGLASGCGGLVFAGMAIHLVMRGDSGEPALAGYSIALAGSWLGFLLHNKKPAKIFMGDTGSLAMGAGLSGIGILSNSLWALLIMGGVFLAESVSVITQVWFFKLTKKLKGKGERIFLMAPLHHHFELAGYKEQSIVRSLWWITGILVTTTLLITPSF